MKALPPCQHFTEDQTCSLGYQPKEHCALCRLYQSAWEAERTRLVAWLALFGLAIGSDTPKQKISFDKRHN